MPTLVNLTGNIADLIGTDFNARRTKVWVTTNLPGDVLIDATGNEVRLGDSYATVTDTGTFTFTGLWATNSATNPTAFQYQLHVDYPKRSADRGRNVWDSGWFDLTATADIADVVQGQYVPPTWMTTATGTLQGYVDEGRVLRDEQIDISNISTSDGVVEALVKNTGGAGPLTSAALSATYGRALSVTDPRFGAVGDGVTDDTLAVQAAINAARTEGVSVYFPAGDYLCGALTSGAGRIHLHGDDKNTTIIRATAGLTGYMLTPEQGFNVTDITFVGSGVDGCYGFGAMTGTFTGTSVARVKFYGCEYGIRFEGASWFPLGATWEDVYVYDFRTAGAVIATGGTPFSGQADVPPSGQSGWTFDGIICTNGQAASRSIPAAGFTQSDDTTSTSDTVSWSGTDETEFGYRVMRRPVAATNPDDWQWVATINPGTTSYVATKSAGVYYTYAVVRNSTGVYLRYGKAVKIGVIQSEYVGTGVVLRECYGVDIGTAYQEWRGNHLTNPTPRGNAVAAELCRGVNISAGWAERSLSAVSNSDSIGTRVASFRAADCQRSAVHNIATNANVMVELGAIWASGSTPAVYSTSGSAFDHNLVGRNLRSTDPATTNRFHVDHTTVAEFEVDYRGARKAVIGADTTGGYLELAGVKLRSVNESSPYVNLVPGTEKSHVGWGGASLDATNRFFSILSLSAGVQNDEKVWDVTLDAGSWTATLWHYTATSRGIYTVLVDGVSVGTVDGYAASSSTARTQVTFTVAAPGRHTVTVRMATKNASSTGYFGDLSGLTLTRTGA